MDSAALWGLIGVMVGALLNGGSSFVLARRNERRGTKVVARLIFPELLTARGEIDTALRAGKWSAVAFQIGNWAQHQERLARLDEKTWNDVSGIYTALVLFNQDRRWREEVGDPLDEQLEEDDVAHLEAARDVADDALAGLRKVAGVRAGVGYLSRWGSES